METSSSLLAARPALLLALLALAGCSTANAATTPAPSRPVAAASPPKDDGKAAQAGAGPVAEEGGEAHAAALEQLKTAKTFDRIDKQASIAIPLPDAEHWTRVRFLTVKSLVGFRYGKAHHAVVSAFVTKVPDNQVQGACSKSFEDWAKPYIEAFEVELKHEAPAAFAWTGPGAAGAPPTAPKPIAIVEVDPLVAKTATVLARDTYAGAWAAYPVWDNACLIVGAAIPARGDEERAKGVRDRFVKDVLPKVRVTLPTEPKERY